MGGAMGVILGLGDCIMAGARGYEGEVYLDIVARELGMDVVNRAVTMSTTREGRILFDEEKERELVIVAYGLVDSWKTFKYAPYVLYYPDNFFRKLARKVVKKYKKIARKLGLNELLGQKFVVSPQEFEKNLRYFCEGSKRIIFIETPPHLTETFRNPNIYTYNQIMAKVAADYRHASVVRLYETIQKEHYLDEIHLNSSGYKFVARKILEHL
jgi:lysophospholipase L1-like esterase